MLVLLSTVPARGNTAAVLVTNPLNKVGITLNLNVAVPFSGKVNVALMLVVVVASVWTVAPTPAVPTITVLVKPMPLNVSANVREAAALGPKLTTVTV